MSKTLFDKIWDGHRIATLDERHDLVYVDRIFLHERTGGIALRHLAEQRRRVRFPEQAPSAPLTTSWTPPPGAATGRACRKARSLNPDHPRGGAASQDTLATAVRT